MCIMEEGLLCALGCSGTNLQLYWAAFARSAATGAIGEGEGVGKEPASYENVSMSEPGGLVLRPICNTTCKHVQGHPSKAYSMC